jgi:hypothetical protein
LLQQRRKPEGRFRAPLSGSTAYLCNGAAGADGQSFAGTFTSPNGDYSINVSDAGITIAHGGSNSITLTGDDLTLRSDDIDMRSDRNTTLRDGTTATLTQPEICRSPRTERGSSAPPGRSISKGASST